MSAFDFSGNVVEFDNSTEEPIQVLRHQGATVEHGVVVDEGQFVDVGFAPPYCTWPVSDKFVNLLSAGDRLDGDIVVFSLREIRTANDVGFERADRIVKTNSGETYVANKIMTWSPGGKFFMTTGQRLEPV